MPGNEITYSKMRRSNTRVFGFARKTKIKYQVDMIRNQIVYVTPYGEKYHRETCRYAESAEAMTLNDAIDRGYTPAPSATRRGHKKEAAPERRPLTREYRTVYNMVHRKALQQAVSPGVK